jgi:hypothetical protein
VRRVVAAALAAVVSAASRSDALLAQESNAGHGDTTAGHGPAFFSVRPSDGERVDACDAPALERRISLTLIGIPLGMAVQAIADRAGLEHLQLAVQAEGRSPCGAHDLDRGHAHTRLRRIALARATQRLIHITDYRFAGVSAAHLTKTLSLPAEVVRRLLLGGPVADTAALDFVVSDRGEALPATARLDYSEGGQLFGKAASGTCGASYSRLPSSASLPAALRDAACPSSCATTATMLNGVAADRDWTHRTDAEE